MMQYLHIFQLLGAAFIFAIAIFVFKQNPKSDTHIGFSIDTLATSLWLIFYFFAFASKDLTNAYILFKFGYTFVIFIGLGVYHFVSSYLKLKKEVKLSYFFYLVGFFFAISLWATGYFIAPELIQYKWGLYPKARILQKVYMVLLIFVITRFKILLIRKFRDTYITNDQVERHKLNFVFLSLLFLCIAAMDFLPNYGLAIYPIGFIFAIAYSLTMAYAILRHQLLDIEVIIRRTAVFAGLFAFVYGVFTVVTVIGQRFFERGLGWNQWVALIPTVTIITFTLRPVENFLTNITERFLFQKKYDYRELLRVFTNEILTFLDLQRLTEQTVAGLGSIVKLESAAVLLHDKDAQAYKVVAGQNLKQKDVVFGEDHTLIRYLKVSHKPILREKDADKMHHDGDMNLAFRALNAQLCLPIQSHDLLIGILSLGMKKSGEDYTAEELDILMTLARTEAIAISNAQLFDELSKTKDCLMQREKMAAVGTLAAGMAHEIKNPLAAIRTFTDYLPAKYGESEFREKFCRIVSQEVGRICDIVNNLLMFSKPASSLKRLCSVNDPLRDILDLLSNEFLKRNVCVVSDFQEHQIWVDPSQLKQAFLNVILNAIDAMKARGGSLDVRTRVDAHGVEVRIADTGQGISTENIPRIFDPFYTDKEGGTGLGLAITHSLVEKNGGRIAVESGVGKGTVFVMKFENAVQ